MLNVSRVMSSPRMMKHFTVFRKIGYWSGGRFIQEEIELDFTGIVTAGGTKDIIQVPEGDRTSSLMVFHSKKEMFVSHNDIANKGTSDEIEWNGQRYKIFKVMPWNNYGYYNAFGISVGGD